MQINNELIESLKAERSGIFNWILDGYKIVREQGGFSFDMDKMKAKERRLFKRKIETVREVLRKVFGTQEFQYMDEKGLLDAIPEKIYRKQNDFVESYAEKARQHPGGIKAWLEEGYRSAQGSGGVSYLASTLADLEEDQREELSLQLSKLLEMLRDDLSLTPEQHHRAELRIKEIKELAQMKISKKKQQ